MNAEQIEITSSGLFALLRMDFTEMVTAVTPEDRVAGGAKFLRRVCQINRLADTVVGNPAGELGQAVERLEQVLVSQAKRRQKSGIDHLVEKRAGGGQSATQRPDPILRER